MDPLLIEIPEVIETGRLVLRAPKPDDAVEMNRAVVESLEELKPWMPWANPMPSLEETEHYCRRSAARFLLREALDFRIHLKTNHGFVGNIALQNIEWKMPSFEIGYWIRTSTSGNGYMTEAVIALAALAFNQLRAVRVEIKMDDKNVKSIGVAERAGFELEGIIRHSERRLDGTLRDARIYSRISG